MSASAAGARLVFYCVRSCIIYCCRELKAMERKEENKSRAKAQKAAPVTVPPKPNGSKVSSRVPSAPVHTSTPKPSNPSNDNKFVKEEKTSSTSKLPQQEKIPNKTKPFPKLQDGESSDEFKQLEVEEIKFLLTIYGVDFKGCTEKNDLLEKLIRLWEYCRKHKENPVASCKLCRESPLDFVVLDSEYIPCCMGCCRKLSKDPTFGQKRAVRVVF